MLIVSILNVIDTECHRYRMSYAECCYSDCLLALCSYDECHFSEYGTAILLC
jgi:hypothetical protein